MIDTPTFTWLVALIVLVAITFTIMKIAENDSALVIFAVFTAINSVLVYAGLLEPFTLVLDILLLFGIIYFGKN